jgi:hypothetical protein
MEIGHLCSSCGSQAALICICSQELLCRVCTPVHLTQHPSTVHTFLPISAEPQLRGGDDHYSVVRRSQLTRCYKEYLRAEIDALEQFKQSTLSSVEAKANSLTETLNALVAQKVEGLTRDAETAKHEALRFAQQIDQEHIDSSKYDTTVFFKNSIQGNVNFSSLAVFKRAYAQGEYEEQLQQMLDFKVTYPTESLFELTRTPEEFQDWLLVLKNRKEEELKKQERRIIRLTGGADSWNVGGPPTLDAFSFQCNCDIWIMG